LTVFNDVSKPGAGFGTDTNEITVLNKKGKIVFEGKGTKEELAIKIMDNVEKIIFK